MSPFRTTLVGPIPLSFDVVARPAVFTPESGAHGCPECQAPIDLHQPEESQPTRLLGTCSECSRWFLLIEMEDSCSRTFLVELPCADKIREFLEEFES